MHVARQILQAINLLHDHGCDCHRDLLVFKDWLAEDKSNSNPGCNVHPQKLEKKGIEGDGEANEVTSASTGLYSSWRTRHLGALTLEAHHLRRMIQRKIQRMLMAKGLSR